MPRLFPKIPCPCVLIFSLVIALNAKTAPSDSAAGWQAAADAAREGRFETASVTLEKILHAAIVDGNATDAARAILLKTQADSSREKQDGNPLHPLQSLAALLDETQPPQSSQPRVTLPAVTTAILHYALANQYLRLTPSRQSVRESRASVHRRYFVEAARHYQLALANPSLLQQTPIETLDPLITQSERERKPATTHTTTPAATHTTTHTTTHTATNTAIHTATHTTDARSFADKCRPTLYDFLVFEAIDFLTTISEPGFLDPETSPALPDATPLLAPLLTPLLAPPDAPPIAPPITPPIAPPDAFLSWTPTPAANRATIATLYQNLLRFHQDDPAPQLALAEASLRRIMWAASLLPDSGAPSKATRLHEAALRDFIDHWRNAPGIPTVATACAELAALQFESSPDAAHAAAEEGARLYPDSPGAARCRAIIAWLKAPDLIAVATEHTWNAPWPDITLIHRNISQVHFRAVPCDWEEFFKNKRGPLNRISKEDMDALLKITPARTWSLTLPAMPARVIREEKQSAASIARSLKPGFHFVIASADREFSREGSRIFCAPVWVSDLAIVHTPTDDGRFNGCVVDALTGNPVAGASVTAWRDTTNTINGHAITSDDGAFSIAPMEAPPVLSTAYNCYLVARAPDGRAIASAHALKPNPPSPFQTTANRALFFTDRSVYHPGETVHYKILAVRKSDDGGRPSLLTDHDVSVELRAPNEKMTRAQTLRTGAFGSASGSFALPETNATGAYYLSSDFQKIIGGAMITVMPRAAVSLPPEPVETISISAAGPLTTTAPATLTIKASGGGAPIFTRGTLSIHPVKEPKKTSRTPLLHFRNPNTPPQPAAPGSAAQTEAADNPLLAKPPLDNPPLEKPRVRQDFTTAGETGTARITARLPAGLYRAIVSARGPSGKTITASTTIRVFNPKAVRSPAREEIFLEARSWELRPGETFSATWIAGTKNARACFSFEQDGRILRRFWSRPGVTRQTLDFPITETMRGGVCLRVFQVNDNRFIARRHDIFVPHDNRLAIDWDRDNAPPRPGSRATWTLGIQNTDTMPADAEVAALLYDNTSGQFFRHEWPALTDIFRFNYPGHDIQTATNTVALFDRSLDAPPPQPEKHTPETHRRWNASAATLPGRSVHVSASEPGQPDPITMMEKYTVTDTRTAARKTSPAPEIIRAFLEREKSDPNGTVRVLSLVTPPQTAARSRPAHTLAGDGAAAAASAYQTSPAVFFFPALRTGKDGKLRIPFDVPENMARSKLMLFAHDRRLNFALLTRNFAPGTTSSDAR